jgi:predicted tellurium resistance membrane protein TerC
LELLAVFAQPDAWVTLLVLILLEMILGIDNLVFIAITTDRLPENKQKLGRRFGLTAALLMRIIFLCFASWITNMVDPFITLPFTLPAIDSGISGRDLILLVGGIYLVIKGIQEVREKLRLTEERHAVSPSGKSHLINLPQAIGTIAVMDIIFSIDSVITAVGLAGDKILVMILAVMIAVFIMIIFADQISNFINKNPEVKILALVFIVAVGIKLIVESLGIEIKVEGMDIEVFDLMLYFAMAFALAITLIQMLYNNKVEKLHLEQAEQSECTEQVKYAERAPKGEEPEE